MTTSVWVYSMLQSGKGAWSEYEFNFDIEAFALLGDTLYLRHGDNVSIVDSNITDDQASSESNVSADGIVQWPWLDCGSPGATKMLEGFDIVATSDVNPNVEFGYDQLDATIYTTPYEIEPDSLTGTMIPMPLAAPSISPRLTWTGGAFTLNAFSMYVQDTQGGI